MSTERKFLSTFTSLFCITLFAMTANMLSALAYKIGPDFGMSEAKFVKWTFSIQFTGFVAMCFLGGSASDRFGKRACLFVCSLLVALGCLIWITAPTLWVLYIGAIIVGMGGGMLESVGCAVLNDLHPTRSKLFMNLSQIFYCLGAIGVGFAVGFLSKRGVGWRWFYGSMGALAVLVAVGFAYSRFPVKESETSADTSTAWERVLELIPNIWLPTLAIFLYVFGETAVYAFAPTYLKQLGAGDQVATLSIAVFWGAVVIGRIGCSFLPQNQTYEPVIGTLFLLSAIAAFCQNLVTGWGSGLVLLALLGLALSGTWPLIVSMITIRNMKYSGTAAGIAVGCGALGCVFSPLTLGTIFDKGYPKLAFTLLGGCFVLGLVCIILTWLRERRLQRS